MTNVINHRSDISAHGTTVYASALRTSAPNTMEYELEAVAAATFIVDVTAQAGSGTVTVKVEGVDRVSGKTFPITSNGTITATTSAIAANATVTIQIAPSLASQVQTTNTVLVNSSLPNVVRVTATQGGTSVTYSVGMLLS